MQARLQSSTSCWLSSNTGQQIPEAHSSWVAQVAPRGRVPVEITWQRPVVGEQTCPRPQLVAVQPGLHRPARQMVSGGLQPLSSWHSGLSAWQVPSAAWQYRPGPHSLGNRQWSQRSVAGLHQRLPQSAFEVHSLAGSRTHEPETQVRPMPQAAGVVQRSQRPLSQTRSPHSAEETQGRQVPSTPQIWPVWPQEAAVQPLPEGTQLCAGEQTRTGERQSCEEMHSTQLWLASRHLPKTQGSVAEHPERLPVWQVLSAQ
jgi:hypothetical protein